LTARVRDTSGEVAEDGILPGEFTNIPGPVQIYLIGLLTTESFCSAVGQRCQGQGGQDDKQIELHEAVESK
jgi:hypothetical protein